MNGCREVQKLENALNVKAFGLIKSRYKMKKIKLINGLSVTVDDEDYRVLRHFQWRWSNKNVVMYEKGKGYIVAMHRFILGITQKSGCHVIYRDGNKLNNCKANLCLKIPKTPTEMKKEWRDRYPLKAYAQGVIFRATIEGRIKRPNICSICHKYCKPESHHRDYSKPLEVIWLCRKCHLEEHRKPDAVVENSPEVIKGILSWKAPDGMMNIKDIAKEFNLTVGTVLRHIRQKKIKMIKHRGLLVCSEKRIRKYYENEYKYVYDAWTPERFKYVYETIGEDAHRFFELKKMYSIVAMAQIIGIHHITLSIFIDPNYIKGNKFKVSTINKIRNFIRRETL